MNSNSVEWSCPTNLPDQWTRSIHLLGGTVIHEGRPETYVNTATWSEQHWDLWRKGGIVEIDQDVYGVISFYIGSAQEIRARAVAHWRIVASLWASGATDIVPQGWNAKFFSALYRLPCQQPISAFEASVLPIASLSSHIMWPEKEADPAVGMRYPSFRLILDDEDADLWTGPCLDLSSKEVCNYVAIRNGYKGVLSQRSNALERRIHEALLSIGAAKII